MDVSPAEHRALISELDHLISEERNPNTMEIDLLTTDEVLRVINREDRSVPDAVGKVIAEIARAVDRIVDAFGEGGRLIYIGAGTSGRLGVLDAAECPPTFNTAPGQVVGWVAGGPEGLVWSAEELEDSPEAGRADAEHLGVSQPDAVVGITASGRTPYVLG